MVTENFKKEQEELQKKLTKRNEEIVMDAVLNDFTCRALGKKHNLSFQRIHQILKAYNVKVPLKKGTPKYERWRRRIITGLRKKV